MKIRLHKATITEEILSPKVLLLSSIIAILYLVFSLYFINFRLVVETIIRQGFSSDTFVLLGLLLTGVTTLFRPYELVVMIVIGFLMGMNLRLIYNMFRQEGGKISFGLGFATAVASTGCPSCGLTVLSFLGPSVSASLLPFNGLPLQLLSISLLLFSLIYNLNRKTSFCRITK